VLLLLEVPLAIRIFGAAVLGLAAGIPFAAAFSGAQAIRPDGPGAAIGFINSCATFVIALGTPLVGLTFSIAGHGRVGFAAIAALWALQLSRYCPRGWRAYTGPTEAGALRPPFRFCHATRLSDDVRDSPRSTDRATKLREPSEHSRRDTA
jgi:hypothetical protein